MSKDHSYHRERERHCRSMAKSAVDAEVRRRHEELANLHAARAGRAGRMAENELSAA
jgi:hypothetical protein